ncbi:MAG: hypothetical protein IT363_09370 [Methanoregulaceae archaeon]|nr:hypothetical protein [Methanoregulaceae archaeon]
MKLKLLLASIMTLTLAASSRAQWEWIETVYDPILVPFYNVKLGPEWTASETREYDGLLRSTATSRLLVMNRTQTQTGGFCLRTSVITGGGTALSSPPQFPQITLCKTRWSTT